MSKTVNLSVVLNTKNSQLFLRECLESIKNIADEIIVVDMNSEDETLKIAKEFGAKVFQYPNPNVGYADPAREFAFSKASGVWLLMIDSDESISTKLAQAIKKITLGKPNNLPTADAYYLARRNYIFGKAIEKAGWYPDYQMRLWKKGVIKWHPQVHSVPDILSSRAYFPADKSYAITHHNYQEISQFINRANKYSDFAAKDLSKRPTTPAITPQILWNSFFAEFFRRGFQDEGLLEGNHGVVLSLMQAQYQLQTQAKIWQAQGFKSKSLTKSELKAMRRQFLANSHYWWADLMVKQTSGLEQIYYRLRRKFKL